jgi:inosine-uridine nucleoside N-ribohydrolase
MGTPVHLDIGKVIIDTDAGPDDAAAIFVALNYNKYVYNSSLEVIAITCVYGNTAVDNVVVNVLKTLQTADRLDVPVYRGASKSLLLTPPQDNYFGEDGFGDFEYPNPPDPDDLLQSKHAVIALIDTVNKYPGEVTLLCIGPLTNVALALRLDPKFLTKLKNLVVMGGSVEGVGNIKPGIEFNFYVDPEAAFIVFNSTDTSTGDIQPIILLPYESVSERNVISMDWRMNVLGTLPSSEVELLNNAERYHLGEDILNWGCADCLAVAATVNSSIIEHSATLYAYVSVDGTLSRGAVFVDYKGSTGMPHNIIILRDIDVDSYKTLLLSTIGGIPPAKG